MFKAVKMKRLKFLLLSFVLGCAMLAGAQTPEVFPLWPQGVKENNGIKVDRTVDDQGGISNNSTAELLVFHPDPAKNTGKAVLICPGGGYTYLAMGYEGEEFAQWLVKQGITGIVLKYRMPNQHDRIPMTDALRAMKWVRSRSEEWGIDPAKVRGYIELYTKSLRENVSGKPVNTRSLRGSVVVRERKTKCTQV